MSYLRITIIDDRKIRVLGKSVRGYSYGKIENVPIVPMSNYKLI